MNTFYKVTIKEEGFSSSLYFASPQDAVEIVSENTREPRMAGAAFSITIELCNFQQS
jgi:hypothetical protein